MQAAGGDQRAGGDQDQAEDQVNARAHRAMGLEGIDVEDQHIQQADRDAHGQTAEQHRQNIARGRRFSISSRSTASSLGFSAATNVSAKNSAFIAGQPASGSGHGR